ncbi:MAG: DUF4236 domain-containing protein [Synergistaceae bacterium]|nr:DUF4236 domain-containing protein [Synergistaceae bacterium]
MAIRFRKTKNIVPGVRLNVTKRGISTNIGPRGTSINVGKKGIFGNVGIPGTGLSVRKKLSGNGKAQADSENVITDTEVNTMPWLIIIVFVLIGTWFIGFTTSFLIGAVAGIVFRFKLKADQKKQPLMANNLKNDTIDDEDAYEGDVGGEDEDEEAFDTMTENFKSTYDEVSRKRRAMDKKYIPLTLDRIKKSGTFKGSSGEIYETTLDSCTCIDSAFNKGTKCKHIYRLEHELGICDLSATPKESKAAAKIRQEAASLLNDISQYWEFMSLEDLKSYINKIETLKLQQEEK